MTNIEQAYLRGFCKMAEAHGVNPEVLAKYAQYTSSNPYAAKQQELQNFNNYVGSLPAAKINTTNRLNPVSTKPISANDIVNAASKAGKLPGGKPVMAPPTRGTVRDINVVDAPEDFSELSSALANWRARAARSRALGGVAGTVPRVPSTR